MLARVLMVAVAVLNLLPSVVAVAPAWSVRLYGIALSTPALDVAMRHRAVLLGAVGAGLGVAAFVPSWWSPALALALASKVAFLSLWFAAGRPPALAGIARADVVALVILAVVTLLRKT
jgi:hypothetical protein